MDAFKEGDTVKLALIEEADGTLKVLGADGEIRRFISPLGAIRAHAQEAEFMEAEACGFFDALDVCIVEPRRIEAHDVA